MKTNTSRLCSGMLLVVFVIFVAAAVGRASDEGGSLVVAQMSENEALGYLPGENLVFQIQSGWKIISGPTKFLAETLGKRMTKIEFYLGEKTLLVQAARDELYIKGFITGTGRLTGLTERERTILKDALENNANVELGDNTDLFLNSLNVLSSWPENMLVFLWHDSDSAMSAVGHNRLATMPRKDFTARNTEAFKLVPLDRPAVEKMQPPTLNMTATNVREIAALQSWTSICSRIGHSYTGRYFKCNDFLGLCLTRRYFSYTHLVGGRSCFGRCGGGCTGVPRVKIYTRDCFNHDACVTRLGRTAWSCDIMFTFCADDIINAPKCR
jgi:hypothetical protein